MMISNISLKVNNNGSAKYPQGGCFKAVSSNSPSLTSQTCEPKNSFFLKELMG